VTTLSPAQLAGAARSAGFSGPALVTAVAVALAESGGRTDAVNTNRNGSRDLGLWQINDRAHPWITGQSWQDPKVNAAAAYRVYREASGSFRPWVAFTSGSSSRFTLQAAQGAQAPADPPSGGGGILSGLPVDLPGLPGVGDAVDAAKSAGNAVRLVASAGAWISNPHNWLRVAYVIVGGAMVVAGLQLTVSGRVQKIAAPITGVAKTVATKGKAPA